MTALGAEAEVLGVVVLPREDDKSGGFAPFGFGGEDVVAEHLF